MLSTTRPTSPFLILGAVLLSLAACRSTPPPPPPPGPLQLPPALKIEVSNHLGTILGGPRAFRDAEEVLDSDPTQALVLNLRVLALEELPTGDLERLASRTRIVASPSLEQPIRGATRLANGASFARNEDAQELWQSCLRGLAGRSIEVTEYTGALLREVTCTLTLDAIEVIEDPDNFLDEWPKRGPVRKRLALAIERRAPAEEVAELGIALGFSNLAQGAARDVEEQVLPAEGGRPGGDFLQHEWVVPDLIAEVDVGPLVLIVPSPFETGEDEAFALWLELSSPLEPSGQNDVAEQSEVDSAEGGVVSAEGETVSAPAEEEPELSAHAASVQLALLDVNTEAAAVTRRQTPLSIEAAARQAVLHAFTDLDPAKGEGELRGPLLYIASVGEAPLTADLGLVADQDTLRGWLERLPQLEFAEDVRPAVIAWQLERTAWLYLADLAQRDDLALELDSVLLRHAGEAGRYPSTIEESARIAPTRAHFQARLIAENTLFLEDSNLSARVRAFDWLTRLEAAPDGFDPLASRQARQAALAGPAATETPSTQAGDGASPK